MSEQQTDTASQETNSCVAQQGPPPPHPPPSNSFPNHPEEASRSVPEQHHRYKNRLQEYTQKYSLQLPVYQTINEGAQHAPKFRSTVLVDGTYHVSPNTFPHRKTAEQDAARVALIRIYQKMKDDGCPQTLIREDTTFCKSILNEYAVKKRIEIPTYHTVKLEGLVPVFVSSLAFNGATYTGETGRNKKEAEQLAARAAVLSILESESGEIMSEIIKSKSKLYAALNKIKHIDQSANPIVDTGNISVIQSNKRKEPEVTGIGINMPIIAALESSSDEPAKAQALPAFSHEFKMPKTEIPSETIACPIEFIPAEFPQPVIPSTSGVKRSRKNKKKAKKGLLVDAQMAVAAAPLRQIPPCSVAQ